MGELNEIMYLKHSAQHLVPSRYLVQAAITLVEWLAGLPLGYLKTKVLDPQGS